MMVEKEPWFVSNTMKHSEKLSLPFFLIGLQTVRFIQKPRLTYASRKRKNNSEFLNLYII